MVLFSPLYVSKGVRVFCCNFLFFSQLVSVYLVDVLCLLFWPELPLEAFETLPHMYNKKSYVIPYLICKVGFLFL